ncbi:metal homeostatis protein bsd2 [Mucor ambiguus]|uniref:Metal homeostatis protein bsd2 n=1 Tax=Mucor ambiguus TaxID=91626 RepID=A0A0C9MQ44_9FUNG|nr:metal homeostatis protein bsd2 [Mucor ambiguus]
MSTRYQKLSSTDQDNHHYEASSSAANQQQNDLQDSFGESFDDDHTAATDRLLQYHHNDHSDDDDDDDHITLATITNSSQPHTQHPQQEQLHQPINNQRGAPAVLPVSTDGVFANMSAKPETESSKLDETPPTYEEAAADATPPYWQTTIIAPAGMGDIVLVEGMPVGSIFAFFWNLLISASFQFVGFMLTYLLHTSHASKQGSRAGLGISLVQTGFYIRSRGTLEDDDYYYGDQDGTTKSDSSSSSKEDSPDADIIAYFLMMVGWFIIIRSLADYFRAKQMEKIICSEPTTGETMV